MLNLDCGTRTAGLLSEADRSQVTCMSDSVAQCLKDRYAAKGCTHRWDAVCVDSSHCLVRGKVVAANGIIIKGYRLGTHAQQLFPVAVTCMMLAHPEFVVVPVTNTNWNV